MESIIVDLLAFLDVVILEQIDNGLFKVIGTIPDWFAYFYPDSLQEELSLERKFPFLENFLVDAEYSWQKGEPGLLKSGLWVETDLLGNEHYLEATAIWLKNRRMLLIELAKAEHNEKQFLIQKGRENSLLHERLVKEIQKKEVFIHCLVHDLLGELTAVHYCFKLLELQNLTPKGREYVEIGKRQTIKQEILVQEISDIFSIDEEFADNFKGNSSKAADLLICVTEVVRLLLPTFLLNKKQLLINPTVSLDKDWKVVGEKLRLERVISNLLENAFRHSPPDSTVAIDIKEDNEFVLLTVDDEGPGVAEGFTHSLFKKFSQGKEKAGRAGLGLYFCRITVELWGGSIGYVPRQEGGARFWFRLPKAGHLIV